MDVPFPAPLTIEQLAAINAGDGHARLIDPGTQVVYHVIGHRTSRVTDDFGRVCPREVGGGTGGCRSR